MAKVCICASSIIIKNRKVLLLWHEKLGVWLYPGGHVEDNETPMQAALRETLEETGMKVSIVNTDNSKLIKTERAYELPRPFMILYENVPYKSGAHEHFDMIYLSKLEDAEEAKFGKGEVKNLKWFQKSEIDNIETYDNVKYCIHEAFLLTEQNDKK